MKILNTTPKFPNLTSISAQLAKFNNSENPHLKPIPRADKYAGNCTVKMFLNQLLLMFCFVVVNMIVFSPTDFLAIEKILCKLYFSLFLSRFYLLFGTQQFKMLKNNVFE